MHRLFFSLLHASLLPGLIFAQAPTPELAAEKDPVLPEIATSGGVRFVDLDEDGHLDLVVSNPQGYGVYLHNPVEKKNVQWEVGFTIILREGVAGDAGSLPLITGRDGRDTGVKFQEGAMISADGQTRIPYAELLKVVGPPAFTPEESLERLLVPTGWTAQLAAHEPLVQDPVFIDWDAKGRMWVVEMGDYPFAPGEKTKDGKVGQGKVSDLQTGRVKILEDTDADGRYDKASLFLNGLTHPTGLAFWKNGVFIASIPDILYAEDTDGDGRADKREVWFSGFTAGNPQHLVNGFCWGLDGWLYGANGDSGGDLTCVKSGKKVQLATNDFRFHPETGEFALETGRSQCGKWRDDYGNWFGNNNSAIGWHYHVPMRYLEKHPDLVVKSVRASLNDDKRVFPISPPVPRFNWASATNTLTSACSPMPWTRGAEEWLLVCEPANNLVLRQVLDHTRLPITSARHEEDEEQEAEFIASADNWCRPCQARVGPDGALYVVDMYRLVLEHPEWIPEQIAKRIDLRAGEDRGRIYRIVPPPPEVALGAEPPPEEGTWKTPATTAGLCAAMNSSIRWRRNTAQRLLLEKQDPSAVAALQKLAAAADTALSVRLQALWTVHLLTGGREGDLVPALKAAWPKARGAALMAAGSQDIKADELASWFPKDNGSKAVAAVPTITRTNADRQKVTATYITAVRGLKGDAKRGEAAFQKACMACHKLGGIGIELGPDLGTVAAKPMEQILEAIFDPNRAVELRHAATQVIKKDGTLLTGLIVAETPGGITLRIAGGVDMPVARDDIRQVSTLDTSLMPEGLESVLTPQDTADLLAWMQAGK